VPEEPNCFVLMPIGDRRRDGHGDVIDFDRIYRTALRPAIVDAGMRPLRDDDVGSGGLVQTLAFEALLLSEFVVADLTTPNPNVLYELGIRHAARPSGTIAVTARPTELPFAVHGLRCVRYELDGANRLSRGEGRRLRAALVRELRIARESRAVVDSPVFQLLPGWRTDTGLVGTTGRFRAQALSGVDSPRVPRSAHGSRGLAPRL
jgi:hypothetical protein